jgi:hypothetical protein
MMSFTMKKNPVLLLLALSLPALAYGAIVELSPKEFYDGVMEGKYGKFHHGRIESYQINKSISQTYCLVHFKLCSGVAFLFWLSLISVFLICLPL